MILGALADGLVDSIDGNKDAFVYGITADSRLVKPGYIFAALDGAQNDGAEFVPQALEKGAIAVLANKAFTHSDACLISVNPRRSLAKISARLKGVQPQTIAAVTGTAGKTSVVSFLRQIWEHTGLPSASLGTTGIVAKGVEEGGSLTTPDPVSLAEIMFDLASNGVTHCAMEASSHGLDQYRLDGMKISVAGFTNLGRDHMDYHVEMEDYFDAKMRLFRDLLIPGGPAIIYSDDIYSKAAIEAANAAGNAVYTVGRAGEFISLKRVEHGREGQVAEIVHNATLYRVDFPLPGGFQLSNALVAAGMAIVTGSNPEFVFKALGSLKGASGRLEKVGSTSAGAPCYVDYAHKPEALEHVLKAVRPFTTGRIVLVFGCGGDRDSGKREIMGDIAERLTDITIVTDDNPRTEDPAKIRSMVMEGAVSAKEIADRAEAIKEGVKMLMPGDCLIVAGKGHENGQKIGQIEIPFLDHDHIRKALIEQQSKEIL